MRLVLLSVVVLAVSCVALDATPANPDIQDVVFEKWCKASAVTEYEAALVAFNAKHEAWTKSAANTATLFAKYDAAKDALTSHKESIAKAEHRIGVLTRRLARLEKKKLAAKRNLHPNYDTVNWASEHAQCSNVIASLNGLHDKVTVELVASSLRNYMSAIKRTQAKIAAYETRAEGFEKDKRDVNAHLSTLHAGTARLSEVHNYTKNAHGSAKKFSDGAETSFKEAQATLTSTANHVNACVNKGFLPADAAVNAAAAITKAAAGTKAALSESSGPAKTAHVKKHKRSAALSGKRKATARAGPKHRHRRRRATKKRSHRRHHSKKASTPSSHHKRHGASHHKKKKKKLF